MPPHRILVCPDSFKGSLSAVAASAAIANGIRQVYSQAQIQSLPLADGGEGTVEALLMAVGGERRRVEVTGPLGDRVRAQYGLLRAGQIAVVELAQASGLPLVPETQRDPRYTTTYGTGELILEACGSGSEEIWTGIGGSATNDGGAGIGMALGFELLDGGGDSIGWGGGELLRLDRIKTENCSPLLAERRFRVICDVHNPLIGPQGATAIYGPQKGVRPQQIEILDQALAHFAEIVRRDLQVEILNLPGSGAAGGAGGGLVAFLGATLEPGIALISEQLQLRDQIKQADLIITGEGSLDRQSLMGKVISGVIQIATEEHKPVIALAGCIDPAVQPALQDRGIPAFEILSLTSDPRDAMNKAAEYLEILTANALRS